MRLNHVQDLSQHAELIGEELWDDEDGMLAQLHWIEGLTWTTIDNTGSIFGQVVGRPTRQMHMCFTIW